MRPSKGATRQNSGVLRIESICPNWTFSGAGVPTVSLRGATAKISMTASMMTPAKTTKAERQPMAATRYSVGSVATSTPQAPTAMMAVLASERRSIGTHVAEDL